jgi:hypothetical protein
VANISITRYCRRKCSYCFAQHELSQTFDTDMSPEVFDAALSFLERSNIPVARLLGGEPTEHPLFREYVTQAHERGFRVVVFSGGLIPEPALEYMMALPAERFSLVLNLGDPKYDEEALLVRQREVCRALGDKVMLGVNISSPGDNPAHALEWLVEYGLCRTIRVGISHPIWGGTNQFFHLRRPRVVAIFERLVASGAEIGVDVQFDCGFTPCMFTQKFVESHADMFMQNANHCRLPNTRVKQAEERASFSGKGTDHTPSLPTQPGASEDPGREVSEDLIEAIGVRCSPVVDILPEGNCIACYALSRVCRFPLPSDRDRDDLASLFDRMLSPILPVGVFRECTHCEYRTHGMCGGGCRARRASRLRPDPLTPLRVFSPSEISQR